jgi:SAM-dependent methyltransferase
MSIGVANTDSDPETKTESFVQPKIACEPLTSNVSTAAASPRDVNAKPEVRSRDWLIRRIQQLEPWHMNIELTEELHTGQVYAADGMIRNRSGNSGISLLSLRDHFFKLIDSLYPQGLQGKRFLDCACNAGGYCFWARQREASFSFGFDVRDHWIKQAQFIKNHRKVAPTDRIQFQHCDLYDLSSHKLGAFDITNFKGIFYHLPDPIAGLRIAADMTREILIFDSSTTWAQVDGHLKAGWESEENLMSGVHGLKWYPTGPQVCADILKWLGFGELKLMFYRQQHDQPQLGRVQIVAARQKDRLKDLRGQTLA